ncbi:MAG: S41 family peptidase, partial [Shewanella sp.]
DGNAIKLTIAQYNTPKGENIHNRGIVPDISIPDLKIAAETGLTVSQLAIIDTLSPHASLAQDHQVTSAIAWIQHHDE